MTPKEAEALEFIEAWIASRGTGPTVREIARGVGHNRSHSYAAKLLDGLERRGFIRRLPGRARAIEVVLNPLYKMRTCYFSFDADIKSLVPYRPKQS